MYITGGNLRVKLVAGARNFGFGNWTTTADATVNGYVTIQNANGTTRKLTAIA